MNLHGVIEGLLFVVGSEGITFEKLKEILNISEPQLEQLLNELKCEYQNSDRGFNLECLGNCYKLVTKSEHQAFYDKLVKESKSETLSQAALETLAIIAYNQPVTRLYVDEIRGVDSAHIIRKLHFRNLIKEVGRAEQPGKPILYGITDQLLDYLGLASINDLPKIEEVKVEIDDNIDLYSSKYKEM